MKQEVQYLLEIVKYISNNKSGELAIPAKDMDWGLLVKLAQNHSISNLVHYGVDCLPSEHKPDEETCKRLYQSSINAIVRSFNQIEGTKELFQAFEKEGIYALAVKGICTKQHYPQQDMRTMGDVDILYQPQQNDKVKKGMRDLGYEQSMEGRKHDIYSRRPYMAIEMHRELVAAGSKYGSYYESIWNRVKTKENSKYIYEMNREDEYIFTIVHLAGHFKDGGIGIRFVMDVYVYNHLDGMDWDYVETELKKLKLWEFYENISQLAEAWFGIAEKSNEESNELINRLSTFIITNGTFGSTRNAAAAATAGEGRFQSLLNAVFPSLKSMQSMFEWLKKWPILLPYAWILRGIRSVMSRRRRMNIKYHVDKYRSGDKEYGEELQRFFEICGL